MSPSSRLAIVSIHTDMEYLACWSPLNSSHKLPLWSVFSVFRFSLWSGAWLDDSEMSWVVAESGKNRTLFIIARLGFFLQLRLHINHTIIEKTEPASTAAATVETRVAHILQVVLTIGDGRQHNLFRLGHAYSRPVAYLRDSQWTDSNIYGETSMERGRRRQESTSELPQEPVLRSIPISVKATTRLRSGSGGVLFPSASGRVRSSDSTSSTGSLGRSGSVVGQWVKTTLYLTETRLYYEALGQVCTILLEDLIGAQVIPQPPPNNPNACEFDINYYPKVFRRGGGDKMTRKLIAATVQFDAEAIFKENLFQAVDWKKVINLQANKVVRKIFHYADVNALQLDEDESMLVPRHLLVLLNPASGPGKTVSDFKQHIQPLFDLAEINYHLIVTERQNHAREIMRSFDVTTIHGIVISSGDGLLYEVVNGLMEREDWERAIKVPIGMLPTGSGNALVASTLHESDEEFSLLNAAFQIIRGGVIPLDIATVQTGDGGKCYMSLLANWGLVADVDIESEKFRKIGETRFILGALNCIIKRRLYRGKISFLPCEPESTEQSTTQTNDNTDSQEQTNDSTDPQEQMDRSEQEPSDKPQEEQSETSEERKVDVTIDIEEEREEVEEGGTNRDTTEQTGTGEEEADDLETSLPASAQAEAQATTDSQSEHSTADSAPSAQDDAQPTKQEDFSQFGPKADLLPSLSGPIPENWETIERDFMAVTLLMIPHMARNCFGDPAFSIGTGKIRVVIIDGQISRLGMFGLLTKADTGDHLEMNGVLRKDVMAFRFEPHTAPGMLTIDGEEVYYGPLQCQIHPTLARVMCRKRRV